MNGKLIDRRCVLAGLGGAAVATWPSVAGGQPVPERHGFLIETGNRGFDDYAVGILVCSRPAAHLARLRSLRGRAWFVPQRTRGYQRALRYSSTDRHRLNFVELALRHFRDSTDMFVSQIRVQSRWPRAASARDAMQLQVYLRVLAQIPSALRDRLHLHAIRRSISGQDVALLNAVQRGFSSPIRIGHDGHDYEDLMALAGVIVGSINAEQSRVITDDTKLAITSDLRAVLGVSALRPNQLNATRKVRTALA